jgi:lipopolysaccharide biosynthesis glycosyltransferase
MDFVKVDLRQIEKQHAYGTWVSTIYAKYFICDLLNEYEKCIWLDGDTLIQDDLTELYKTNLADSYIGAVKSPGTNYNVAAGKHPVLNINAFLKCINVGVLLMDLKRLRSIGGGIYFMNETLSVISHCPKGTPVTEQDIFNKLLVDNIKYLPLKYNAFVSDFIFTSRPYYPFFFDRKTIEEALTSPVIIHYTLPEKPWKYTNAERIYAVPFKGYRKLWDKYYYLSPLADEKLRRKRILWIKKVWLLLKPIMKRAPFLLEIKRTLYHTKIDSPFHDFFD